MTELIYLDTETTGLDPTKHDVWEVAYAIGDGPIESFVVPHSLKTADPKALELNGYWTRVEGGTPRAASPVVDLGLREALAGATLVGSNPAFDAAFLTARWGEAPWHYRMVDIASYAMPVLGYDRPQGLATITADLRQLWFEIPEPDHTAAGDVATLRAAFTALRQLAAAVRK